MKRNPKRLPSDAIVAWDLARPKDDLDEATPLQEFLAGECPDHPHGCGDAAAHRREYEAHADAYDDVKTGSPLRHEPRVAFGGTRGTHVIYWKLDQNGVTYRTGRVRDLVRFDDYRDDTY